VLAVSCHCPVPVISGGLLTGIGNRDIAGAEADPADMKTAQRHRLIDASAPG